ncbi:MAG: kinase anchor protein [Halobacteriaceae archaeon]
MTTAYRADADRVRREARDDPMSLDEYVDRAFEDPGVAAHASEYLLRAVESAGTRTVVEEGEEVERYRFFDDPYNDGEHAVLGNTAMLNDFVDDLRAVAAGHGNEESIVWFAGPTATGKSELKRCLINGLREYSKTPEGRRYTLEWNVEGATDDPGLTYGGGTDDAAWHASPVQTAPLSVFPPETRARLLADLTVETDGPPVRSDADLDPFSREAYDRLEARYRERGRADPFTAVTDPQHLRVTNYVVDVGRGIGVLHAEDAGTPKERLVGSWMPEMFRDFDSRGRKNPQAFSYDGVLSQGNGGLTVVEDAAQHADLLQKLLNVPDERTVKLDKGVGMDLDTQLVVVSNLDLEAHLDQYADQQSADPLKALKRRLRRHRMGYLTNLSLEAQLLWRELAGETSVWEDDSRAELDERVRAPLHVSVHAAAGVAERELAPHAVEAAALYAVVTRLDESDLPDDLDLVAKALAFDSGVVADGEEEVPTAERGLGTPADGTNGVPVTYVRDAVADLLHEPSDRDHPDLDVAAVLTPEDVLDALVDGLADAPLFSPAERAEFEERVDSVRAHVLERQEADVLDAMLRDHRADAAAVEEYVEHVYAWATDGAVVDGRGESAPADPLTLKVFETEQLGFDAGGYDGVDPPEAVERFREERVLTALTRHAWENRTEDFREAGVDPREVPVLADVLDARDWDDVERVFPDFDPRQWDDPPENTQTAALKEKTMADMVDRAGYSPASAELATRRVLREVAD